MGVFAAHNSELMGVFVTNVSLTLSIVTAIILTTFYFSSFKKFKQTNITKLYEWKRNRESRSETFIIHDEPNKNRENHVIFSTKHSLIALFKAEGVNGELRFSYYMR